MEPIQFDLVKFINEGFTAQQKYAKKAGEPGPLDPDLSLKDRYAKIIEHFGHLSEEMIEARVYIPRRSWKNGERSYLDSHELRREFVAEMYDITLFFRAILAYAGVTGEEFAEIAAEKQAYNQVRPDHAINGNAPVVDSPAAELQGLCPSSTF
jgi:hypothetical protein